MRAKAAVGLATLVLLGALKACSPFEAGDDPADGGPEASLDATTDVVADADSGDAGAETGPPLAFCASRPQAVFCDDFDDPGRGTFSFTSTPDGGAVLRQDGGFSPPSSLRVFMPLPQLDVLDCLNAYKSRDDLAAPLVQFHAEYKIAPGGIGPAVQPIGANTVFGMTVEVSDGNAQRCSLYLDGNGTGTYFVQELVGADSTSKQLMRTLLPGIWTKVTFDFTGAAPNRMVAVSFDGATDTIKLRPECQPCKKVIGVGVGLFCIDPTTPQSIEMWFDDLLVTP